MSAKQEPTSEHSYPYHALSAVQLLCHQTRSTWDTSNHSAKVGMLESMAHLIAVAIEQQVANSEEQS